jgi:hypothetical protein
MQCIAMPSWLISSSGSTLAVLGVELIGERPITLQHVDSAGALVCSGLEKSRLNAACSLTTRLNPLSKRPFSAMYQSQGRDYEKHFRFDAKNWKEYTLQEL